jgi:hypothetical protein
MHRMLCTSPCSCDAFDIVVWYVPRGSRQPLCLCHFPASAGQSPDITTWDLSPWDPAADLAARLAAIPTDPASGQPLLPSDALFVRLPEHVAAEAVADVLLGAVGQLSRTCSAADVQVGRWLAHGAAFVHWYM